MAVGKEEVTHEIVKPISDKREYRRIVLKNSLEVLLVSDPETDKSAASMNVNVGSFSDPEGLEGLAHFLEHMLFYASEKYPSEDSYSKYITEHGGSMNAFTASEQTNYYFEVNADCFEEALDRFAQFFIKPLMSPDATMREIKAVDSENQKNLLSDGWRMGQGNSSLVHASTSQFPYRLRFDGGVQKATGFLIVPHIFTYTGNWDTLEVQPKAKGLDTRHELLNFYENNYSSNVMHLVVYAKENLDKVQILVENIFQDILNHNCNRANFPGQPCTSEHLQVLVRAIPIKQGHKLRIAWPITPEIHHYKEGPCRYLGHLIGHEGEGSLFYVLKTLGWATGLSAGESDSTMNFSFFKVTIDLTDVGQEHMQDVIGLLFKYISLLKESGICQWIFEELSAICKTKFHYQDKIRPIDYVVHLSLNMQQYPPEDWLVGSSLPSKFNPNLIKMVLDQLSVDNFRIFWESKKFEGETDKVEKWYGTAYSIEKISGSLIQDWMRSAPDVKLHLPTSNIFIPTDLSIKGSREKVELPILLRKSKSLYSTIWYKPDTMFSTPKAYIKIDFKCPHANISPEAKVLTVIFTRLLMDYLNEYAYNAEVAGLYYGINPTDSGFQVTLIGYNHKLMILLETVVVKIANFSVKPDRFLVIKETVLKEYQNFKFQQPYHQALYYCSLILEDHSWPFMEELAILPHLGAVDLDKFVPTLLSSAYLECFIAGNVERDEAESMIELIEDEFFKGPNPVSRPLYPSQHPVNRVVKLEKGIGYIYSAEGLNPNDENSALVHYIQVHRDEFLQNVKLQLFAHVAKQAAFHQLRTVEQLGYITVLMQRNDSGIRGVQFIIQSTAKGPRNIDLRVEAFLEMFKKKLVEMSIDEFKSNVNALIDAKLEKFKNLREESGFYWREIADGTLKFDRRESEVAALKTLRHQDLINFFNEHINVGAPRRKALSVRVYGNLHSSEYSTDLNQPFEPNTVKIDDIYSFRRSQPLYGSFKGAFGNVKL